MLSVYDLSSSFQICQNLYVIMLAFRFLIGPYFINHSIKFMINSTFGICLSPFLLFWFAEILKVLMEAIPEISMTVDLSNTTALHTAAAQGHFEAVDFLLQKSSSLVTIAKSNGKTIFHSAARNGHVEIIKALLSKEPEIATRIDKKGQTALHMAVKGQNLEVVDELVKLNPSLANMVDAKGNTALHIATRKGRLQVKKRHHLSPLMKVLNLCSFLFRHWNLEFILQDLEQHKLNFLISSRILIFFDTSEKVRFLTFINNKHIFIRTF